MFSIPSYDERKAAIAAYGGAPRYSEISDEMQAKHRAAFVDAARQRLALAINLFAGLPSPVPD